MRFLMASSLCLPHRPGRRGGGRRRESNAKHSPNFNINWASWLPGILKRQEFKWTSLPAIRRPESLWKMSYGYFWRTKCSFSPRGKPWIAGVGITWKEGLADALGTCHWRSVFRFTTPLISIWGTVQKDSCICKSFCEKFKKEGGEKRQCRKMCFVISHPDLRFTFGGRTWLATRPRVHVFLSKCPRLGCLLEEREATVANLCCGSGVHKVWRMGGSAHADVPLLHLTETTSFWCHPSCARGSQWSSRRSPADGTRTHAKTEEESVKAAPRSSVRHHQFNASFKGNCGFVSQKSARRSKPR